MKNQINSPNFEDHPVEYSRAGGIFVTTKKALIYLFLTVTLFITVGYVVYEYGPQKNREQVVAKTENIQELLDKSIRNIPIEDIRLPNTVIPLHYKLRIKPEIETLTFSGEVTITIEALETTKFIVLNVHQLKLDNISVKQIQNDIHLQRWDVAQLSPKNDSQSSSFDTTTAKNLEIMSSIGPQFQTSPVETTTKNFIQKIENKKKSNNYSGSVIDTIHVLSKQINKINMQYKMHLSKQLKPQDTYALSISFTGNISQSLRGLHENSYTFSNGKKKYILATHMQPAFARQVFPCFDDPSMEATFDISIVHTANMKSLSNMPLKHTQHLDNGWMEDHFETTPPMPTFLIVMTLLDLEYYSSISGTNNISIWAPAEHLKYASYSLENTEKLMSYFAKHFNMKYPLPKLDIVTIPTLPSTATDNWGLILFQESVLLNGEDERETFSFLAKKIAQQWFGNLVSVDWWSDIWLVKGFALLESDEAAVKINHWNSDFTLRVMQTTLALDDYNSASSLETRIINMLQINNLIESTVHYKGSCLLRMLKYSISEAMYNEGIQNFLREWKYKSVSQNDFWNSIESLVKDYLPTGKSISDVMDTWSSHTGYPLITVSRDRKMNSIHITQSKFQVTNGTNQSLWIVPLNYVIGDENERKLWLTNRSITLTNVSSDKWLLFNVKRTGYYRVNYDIENWKLLVQVLNQSHEVIPIENRGQLINDAFKLAENGLLSYEVPFNLTKYLQKEEIYMPWASALQSLEFLRDILQYTYLNGAYEEYIQKLVSPLYTKMQNQTDDQDLLRRLIIETACSVNYEPCIEWAKDLFSKWMENTIPVPYDLRGTIFCSAIRTGGKDEWNFLWNQIRLQKTNSDIRELFMSLGCARDTWLINTYLRNALSGAIPWQYVPYVWKSLSQATSLPFGFKYLRENWNAIYGAYNDKPIILKAIVKDFLYALSSKADLDDLTLLVSNHEKDFQNLASLVQGVVDRVKARVLWSAKHLYQVEQILDG